MTSFRLNVRGTAMKKSRNHTSDENTSFWIKPTLKISNLLKMKMKFTLEWATKPQKGVDV